MKTTIVRLALGLALCTPALASSAQFTLAVGVSIRVAPPAIPVYVQPPCPVEGYLWTPGYWAYGDMGYYWVPGVWLAPPHPGLLWTPGYWGYVGGIYGWHGGYWGAHVGFYGGVNYGGGYGGVGFIGGGWVGGAFRYNTAVMHVNVNMVHNTYVDRTVINNTTVINNHYSFNGPGGITREPTSEERGYMNENHVQPTSDQFNHNHTASMDHGAYFNNNHGAPGNVAMNRVNGRAYNQQGRIANGLRNGTMNAHQAAHVEGQEAAINHEVHTDRQANGGHLTPQQRQRVNRQQNHTSREIYNDKHKG